MPGKQELAKDLGNIIAAIDDFRDDLEETELQPTLFAESGKKKLQELTTVLEVVAKDIQQHFSDWAISSLKK